ncbi:hypothetical protein ACCO45_013200 [Purpureocillium lilacinum]|uniref:Uncharacterized protein n=1 Tax=Purpureocillium lilacinum TaxID=33203 RepID=A0ACC4DA92_PURLI
MMRGLRILRLEPARRVKVPGVRKRLFQQRVACPPPLPVSRLWRRHQPGSHLVSRPPPPTRTCIASTWPTASSSPAPATPTAHRLFGLNRAASHSHSFCSSPESRLVPSRRAAALGRTTSSPTRHTRTTPDRQAPTAPERAPGSSRPALLLTVAICSAAGMIPDWRGGVAPSVSTLLNAADGRNGETRNAKDDNRPRPHDWSAPLPPATASRSSRGAAATSEDAMDFERTRSHAEQVHPPSSQIIPDSGGSSSQSLTRSISNSQESTVTASTDRVATPPASDTNGGRYATVERRDDKPPNALDHGAGHNSQLHHLSAIAAAQDRMEPDAVGAGSRKRMADGEVKSWAGSTSPIKGHSRTTSAVSVASTTGSTIGELSAELRTRLSYAMIKVNHGWQGRSLDEVESLASQAASPASSTSTVHRRHGSSASPRLNVNSTPQVHFSNDPVMIRRKSISPPSLLSGKPMLAPPATIQPSMSMPAPRSNPRRNSNPRYTPAGLAQCHSGSPLTPQGTSNPISRLDQDVAETLLFMSSPGNSANLKHAFSPSGSPGAQPPPPAPRSSGRHALPSGPRRALPSQRPSLPPPPPKKAGYDRPSMPPPPDSPMDLDSPRQYQSPNRSTPKRRTNGAGGGHVRAALSLPSGLALGNGTARKTLRDEDIERMLDRAGAEAADSSDDEEIQLPRAGAWLASCERRLRLRVYSIISTCSGRHGLTGGLSLLKAQILAPPNEVLRHYCMGSSFSGSLLGFVFIRFWGNGARAVLPLPVLTLTRLHHHR